MIKDDLQKGTNCKSPISFKNIINIITFILVTLSLLSGYPRSLIMGQAINTQAWINILLFIALMGYFFVKRTKSIYIIFLLTLFIGYSFVGYLAVSNLEPVISHAFTYAPFINAFLILELKVGYKFKVVLFCLTLSAALGAISATVIHFFYPDVLGLLLKEENIDNVISLGRVYWAGYVIALPLVVQFELLKVYSKKERFIVFVCLLVVIFGAIFTFNRTLLLALLSYFTYTLFTIPIKLKLKALILIGGVFIAGLSSINFLSTLNPNLGNLINDRIVNSLTGNSDMSLDLSIRHTLYGEYYERLIESCFLGQGLGVPFSTFFESSFWADISLVSFILPFGLLGLILYLIFVTKLYLRIKSGIGNIRAQRLFCVILFLALIIALNDDIWSHKYFSIYFVYIINSYKYYNNVIV